MAPPSEAEGKRRGMLRGFHGKIMGKPWENGCLSSGKFSHSHGKSQFLVGKLTISTGPFSIANCKSLPEGKGNDPKIAQLLGGRKGTSL